VGFGTDDCCGKGATLGSGVGILVCFGICCGLTVVCGRGAIRGAGALLFAGCKGPIVAGVPEGAGAGLGGRGSYVLGIVIGVADGADLGFVAGATEGAGPGLGGGGSNVLGRVIGVADGADLGRVVAARSAAKGQIGIENIITIPSIKTPLI